MLKKPRQTKYFKYHKGRISYNFKSLSFSSSFLNSKRSRDISLPAVLGGRDRPFALIALEPARLTASQIAAAELAIKRKILKEGTLVTRIFPHFPVTKKPLEVRMGKGKGSISFFATRIRPGSFLFELSCSSPELAKIAFKVASSKLPFRTTMVQLS